MRTYYADKPDAFEKYANAWLYNFNIQLEEPHMEGEQPGWSSDSVELYEPFDENAVTRLAIKSLWDEDQEQKLINDYNAALLGVYEGEKAEAVKAAYLTYLQLREALKQLISSDWKTFEEDRLCR